MYVSLPKGLLHQKHGVLVHPFIQCLSGFPEDYYTNITHESLPCFVLKCDLFRFVSYLFLHVLIYKDIYISIVERSTVQFLHSALLNRFLRCLKRTGLSPR